jgi:hypothetical protein
MNREVVALTVIYIAAMAALLMDLFIWRPL